MEYPLLNVPDACPVCAADRLRGLHVYRSGDKGASHSPNLGVVGCEACGIVFSHPLPSDAELAEHYSASDGWEDRLSWRDEDALEERRLKKVPVYENHFELLDRHLDRTANGGGRAPRVLDYGCGTAGWLDVFKERGWETVGIEPGDVAREQASRNHHMVAAVPTGETFDLAILSHVLEHVRDPLGTVREVAAGLADGGWLFVSVPDLGRLEQHGKSKYVISGTHIFSYTLPGMANLLARAGLPVVRPLDEPEWDRDIGNPGARLRVLARKEPGRPVAAATDSLRPAVESLRAYGAIRDRKDAKREARGGPEDPRGAR